MSTPLRRSNSRIRRGSRVTFKDDSGKAVGVVVGGPPAIIGKKGRKKDVFPLVLKDHVFVRVKIRGKHFICLEKIANLVIKKGKKVK